MGKRRQYDQALALLQASMDQDPWDSHTNFSLGYTYFELGRYSQAEPYLERAVQVRPMDMDPDQYAYLGMAELKLGNLPGAEWAIRLAVQRQPKREKYHYALGLILEQEGKLADAAREFKAALDINPSNSDARARLGRIESLGDSR
jgi:tetratricopeptide (TPR) repeat protein